MPVDLELAETEIKLFGCTLPEIKRKIRDARLGKLWAIFESDYANHSLTLSRAARAVCLNPDYMNRTLRAACGLSFGQLLIRIRLLEAAKALKAEPGVRIDHVAMRVGFADSSSLRKQFKRRIGSSPSDFRTSGR